MNISSSPVTGWLTIKRSFLPDTRRLCTIENGLFTYQSESSGFKLITSGKNCRVRQHGSTFVVETGGSTTTFVAPSAEECTAWVTAVQQLVHQAEQRLLSSPSSGSISSLASIREDEVGSDKRWKIFRNRRPSSVRGADDGGLSSIQEHVNAAICESVRLDFVDDLGDDVDKGVDDFDEESFTKVDPEESLPTEVSQFRTYKWKDPANPLIRYFSPDKLSPEWLSTGNCILDEKARWMYSKDGYSFSCVVPANAMVRLYIANRTLSNPVTINMFVEGLLPLKYIGDLGLRAETSASVSLTPLFSNRLTLLFQAHVDCVVEVIITHAGSESVIMGDTCVGVKMLTSCPWLRYLDAPETRSEVQLKKRLECSNQHGVLLSRFLSNNEPSSRKKITYRDASRWLDPSNQIASTFGGITQEDKTKCTREVWGVKQQEIESNQGYRAELDLDCDVVYRVTVKNKFAHPINFITVGLVVKPNIDHPQSAIYGEWRLSGASLTGKTELEEFIFPHVPCTLEVLIIHNGYIHPLLRYSRFELEICCHNGHEPQLEPREANPDLSPCKDGGSPTSIGKVHTMSTVERCMRNAQRIRIETEYSPHMGDDQRDIDPMHGIFYKECVYEYMRKYPAWGWTHKLLPADPFDYSDELGGKRPKESVVLPDTTWKWQGDWFVETVHYVEEVSDNHSPSAGHSSEWTYSVSRHTCFKPLETAVTLLRRRKWVRVRAPNIDRALIYVNAYVNSMNEWSLSTTINENQISHIMLVHDSLFLMVDYLIIHGSSLSDSVSSSIHQLVLFSRRPSRFLLLNCFEFFPNGEPRKALCALARIYLLTFSVEEITSYIRDGSELKISVGRITSHTVLGDIKNRKIIELFQTLLDDICDLQFAMACSEDHATDAPRNADLSVFSSYSANIDILIKSETALTDKLENFSYICDWFASPKGLQLSSVSCDQDLIISGMAYCGINVSNPALHSLLSGEKEEANSTASEKEDEREATVFPHAVDVMIRASLRLHANLMCSLLKALDTWWSVCAMWPELEDMWGSAEAIRIVQRKEKMSTRMMTSHSSIINLLKNPILFQPFESDVDVHVVEWSNQPLHTVRSEIASHIDTLLFPLRGGESPLGKTWQYEATPCFESIMKILNSYKRHCIHFSETVVNFVPCFIVDLIAPAVNHYITAYLFRKILMMVHRAISVDKLQPVNVEKNFYYSFSPVDVFRSLLGYSKSILEVISSLCGEDTIRCFLNQGVPFQSTATHESQLINERLITQRPEEIQLYFRSCQHNMILVVCRCFVVVVKYYVCTLEESFEQLIKEQIEYVGNNTTMNPTILDSLLILINNSDQSAERWMVVSDSILDSWNEGYPEKSDEEDKEIQRVLEIPVSIFVSLKKRLFESLLNVVTIHTFNYFGKYFKLFTENNMVIGFDKETKFSLFRNSTMNGYTKIGFSKFFVEYLQHCGAWLQNCWKMEVLIIRSMQAFIRAFLQFFIPPLCNAHLSVILPQELCTDLVCVVKEICQVVIDSFEVSLDERLLVLINDFIRLAEAYNLSNAELFEICRMVAMFQRADSDNSSDAEQGECTPTVEAILTERGGRREESYAPNAPSSSAHSPPAHCRIFTSVQSLPLQEFANSQYCTLCNMLFILRTRALSGVSQCVELWALMKRMIVKGKFSFDEEPSSSEATEDTEYAQRLAIAKTLANVRSRDPNMYLQFKGSMVFENEERDAKGKWTSSRVHWTDIHGNPMPSISSRLKWLSWESGKWMYSTLLVGPWGKKEKASAFRRKKWIRIWGINPVKLCREERGDTPQIRHLSRELPEGHVGSHMAIGMGAASWACAISGSANNSFQRKVTCVQQQQERTAIANANCENFLRSLPRQ